MLLELSNLIISGLRIYKHGVKAPTSRIQSDWDRMEAINKRKAFEELDELDARMERKERDRMCSFTPAATIDPGTVTVTSNVPVDVTVTKSEGQITYNFSFGTEKNSKV